MFLDNSLFNFLANHFEEFIYINAVFLVLMLIMSIAIYFSDESIRSFAARVFRGTVMLIFFTVEILWVVSVVYIYRVNYVSPEDRFHFEEEVRPNTYWVKDEREIFMIQGKQLISIRMNGKDRTVFFETDDFIREYYFSPDGKNVLVVSLSKLFLVNIKNQEFQQIASIGISSEEKKLKGSIGHIQWSPNSDKFVFELSRWSKYTMQDNVYIYSINDSKKQSIHSPGRKISSLYWDEEGEALYYFNYEARAYEEDPFPFVISLYQVPLATLKPKFLEEIPVQDQSVPYERLRLSGITLFKGNEGLSFGGIGEKNVELSSETGSLGIDKDDYLYYIKGGWFRKRLFKVDRLPDYDKIERYQYQGGDLTMSQIRWLPKSRYIIMNHRYWGVLILEPKSGKIGQLIELTSDTFGWYDSSWN